MSYARVLYGKLYFVLFVTTMGSLGFGKKRRKKRKGAEKKYKNLELIWDRKLKDSKFVLSRVLLMAYSSILLEYVLDSTYS